MAIYPKYVVDKDWDSQQRGDIVSYYGSAENYSFGSTGFASIYETILDANNIKVPGAVGADTTTPSPVPYTESRQTIFVVKGDFSEAVSAAGNAKYTLDFQSIYGAPDPTDPEAEDLRTKFVGSIVSEAANDVGIRVSSGEVLFGSGTPTVSTTDNVTTTTYGTNITLKRSYDGGTHVGQWNDSDFVVGGDKPSDYAVGDTLLTAEAIVTNTSIFADGGWIWVGSAYDNNDPSFAGFLAETTPRFTMTVSESSLKSTTLQVRNSGKLDVTGSKVDTFDMVLRGTATFTDSDITVGAGLFNVYGENNGSATLTLAQGSVLTAAKILTIGRADEAIPDTDPVQYKHISRKGTLELKASQIGTADAPSDDIAVNQNGTITMDKASQIYAGDIVNNGTINIAIDTSDKEDWIDAATFTNTDDGSIVITGELKNFSVKRVINSINAGEEEGSVDKADVNVAGITVKPVGTETVTTATAATRKGKVAVAAGVNYETIYLSNRIDEDEDFAKAIKNRAETVSYYVDFNAFQLPKSALKEGVTADTTTILIDGGDRTALTYESEVVEYVDPDTNVRKNVIDGLTFAKDGTNAVADDPDQDGDQSLPEKNVEFVLSGMDQTNPMSYRLLTEGITVEKGVTFTADKMYQKSGTTTIKGELKMGTYEVTHAAGTVIVTAAYDEVTDDPEPQIIHHDAVYNTDPIVETLPDSFQIAGGKVNITETGALTGNGIVSVIATNRDTQGKPIKAELNVTGAPITLSQLEIGANSTVTLTDTNAANFGTVIMRKTNVSDFVGPVLTIIDSTVTANSFDTTKGRVNINFQSQLFVVPLSGATPTIEGGDLNLTVSPDDVALLENYGKQGVPQPELFYTIVHAKLNEKSTQYPDGVVLSCDGDKDGDGYIDGSEEGTNTKYVYTSLGGQGLYVMHEDVAKTLYVNEAWTNKQTGEVVGEGMFYNINAFNKFTEALVAASANEFDTTIKVLSVVNENFNVNLGKELVFDNNITVEAAYQDPETGKLAPMPATFTKWDVTLTAVDGWHSLYVSPAGAVEDIEATQNIDETEDGKTFWIKKGVDITVNNGGLWVNYLHEDGSLVKIEDNVTAGYIGFKGIATVTNTATLTSGGDFQIYNDDAIVSITGTYDAATTTAQAAQVQAVGIGFVAGFMTVDSSKFQAHTFYVTEDYARDDAFSSTVSVDVEDSLWTGVEYVTRFYRENTKIDAEFTFDNSTFDLSNRFRNIVYPTTDGPNDSNAPIAGAEAATFNFINGSTLKVGGVLSNAGEINVVSSTIDAAEFTNNGIVSLTGTVDAPAYVLKDFENGAANADANLGMGAIYLDGKVVFGNTVINTVPVMWDDDDDPLTPEVQKYEMDGETPVTQDVSEFTVATLTNNGSVIVKAGEAAVVDPDSGDEITPAIPAADAFLTGKIANKGNIEVRGILTLDDDSVDGYNITNNGTIKVYGELTGGKIETADGKKVHVYAGATLDTLVDGAGYSKRDLVFHGDNDGTETTFKLKNAKDIAVYLTDSAEVNLSGTASNSTLVVGLTADNATGTANLTADVTIRGATVNKGVLNVEKQKTFALTQGSLIVRANGTVNLDSGSTVDIRGASASVSDAGTINILATDTQQSVEDLTQILGTVQNSNGTINIDGNAKFSAAVSNSGTIKVNATAEFANGIVNEGGTVAMNVDSDQISGSRQASGNVYATIVGGDVKLGNGVNFDWGFADNSAAIEGTTVTTLYGGNVIVGGGETAVTAYVFDKGFDTTVQEQTVTLYNESNSLDIRAKGTVKLSSPGATVNAEREPSNLTVKTLKIATGGVLDFGSVKLVDNAHLTPVLTVLGGESADIASDTITIKVPGDWYKTADTPMLLIDGSAITLTGADANGTYEDFYDRIVKGEATYFSVIDDDLYLDPAKCIKVSKSHDEVPAQGWYQKVSTAVADHPEGPLYVLDSADGSFGNVFFEDAEAYIVGDGDGTEQSPALVFGAPVYGGKRVSKVTGNADANANEVVYLPETLNLKVKTGDTFVVVDADTTATFKSYLVGGDYLDKFATNEDVVNYYRFGDTNLTIEGGNFNYNTQGSSRAIIGGINNELAGRATATLTGDVNLTIAGGTFLGYNVYGGNYSVVSKSLGKNTRIDGNVFLTIDTSAGDIAFTQTGDTTTGGSIIAGSLGHSTITGDTVVTLKGTGSLTGKTLWGGSDGDYTNSQGVIESFVEGDRVLSFMGFSGGLAFDRIDDFSMVEFSGNNVVVFDATPEVLTDNNFAMTDSFNKNVTNWEIAAGATISNFVFDFAGDTLNLTGVFDATIAEGGMEFLGQGGSVAAMTGLEVYFDGNMATGSNGIWTGSVTVDDVTKQFQLAVSENSMKLSVLA